MTGIGDCFHDGRYRLLRLLGEGAHGRVYEVEVTETGERRALKVLHRDVTSRQIVRRFRREAACLRRISSPHIVSVHHFGRTADDVYYFTSDLVDGRDLFEVIRRKAPISPKSTLRVARGIATAVEAAHAENVIHRDLKPENVMLRRPDAFVVVVDFGIAKDLDSSSGLTFPDQQLGTRGFMAPEQINGQVTKASDIFALGVIMYEMLSKRTPFEGRDTESVNEATLKTPPRPIQDANPAVPDDLAALVTEMIAKNPKRRPESMTAVMERIRKLEEGRREHGGGRGA